MQPASKSSTRSNAAPPSAGPDSNSEVQHGDPTAVAVDLGTGGTLLYVGPKDYNVLAELGHELQSVVPVGDWIGPVVVPLMKLLRWVHGALFTRVHARVPPPVA